MSTQSHVEELLNDARLVAHYLAAIGESSHAKLVAAIDAVERLPAPQRTLSTQAVTDLSELYQKARKQVPFKQFYALRNGWRVFPSRRQRWLTAIMVVAAIMFMICTLHLTRIYNRGVDISAVLTALEESEAEIRYGELERRLLDAQKQLGNALLVGGQGAADATADKIDQISSGTPGSSDQFLLAREASHRLLNELVNLDQKVNTVNLLLGRFQWQSRYPIIGQQTVEAYLSTLQGTVRSLNGLFSKCPFGIESDDGKCTYGAGSAKAGTNERVFAVTFDPRLSRMRDTFCGKVPMLEGYAQGKITKAGLAEIDPFIGKLAYSIDKSLGVDTAAAIVRSCALGLSFYSGSFPDIEALNMQVKDTLNLYSLIILPAMYGALGAIVFFMRASLNPQEPNEGWSRTLYRVALGALAGMIMAWLGMGLLGGDDAFESIGLGLFAFAFVLGFSIDVFFDLLENLVKAARRTVGQIGSSDPDETQPGAPVPAPTPVADPATQPAGQ
ncbi:MAG: hypothetical protein M3Y78_07830 [Pseudomonadota bacterium]|nr:hypothetical protein [Pseudomonadota bacterium]